MKLTKYAYKNLTTRARRLLQAAVGVVLCLMVAVVSFIVVKCSDSEPDTYYGLQYDNDVWQRLHIADSLLSVGLTDEALKQQKGALFGAKTQYEKSITKFKQAHTYLVMGDYQRADKMAQDCIDYFEHTKTVDKDKQNHRIRLEALVLWADIAERRRQYNESIRRRLKASSWAQSVGNSKTYVECSIKVYEGMIRQGRYAESIDGYKNLLDFCRHEHQRDMMFDILYSLQKVYGLLGDNEESARYLEQMRGYVGQDSLKYCQLDIARYYYAENVNDPELRRRSIANLEPLLGDGSRKYYKYFDKGVLDVLIKYYIDYAAKEKQNLQRLNELLGYMHRYVSAQKNIDRRLQYSLLSLESKVAMADTVRAAEMLDSLYKTSKNLKEDLWLNLRLIKDQWLLLSSKGDYKRAYDVRKRYSAMLDSVKGESVRHNLAYRSLEYRRDTTILAQKLILQQRAAEFESMQLWKTMYILLVVVVVLGGAVLLVHIRMNRRRRIADEVRKENARLQDAITQRTTQLKQQEEKLKNKNSALKEQLWYANRIQESITPREENMFSPFISDQFVLYKPCSVISGDFYWANGNDARTYICVGDATGHSIPGAFIAMVTSTLLTDIVVANQKAKPAQLLKLVDEKLRALQIGDTVDASMLRIDNKTGEMSLSLARHIAYIVRQNGVVEKIQCTKRSLGDTDDEFVQREFTEVTLNMQSGDVLYLTSDGVESQLGGPFNKKLKRNGMIQLLVSYKDLPLEIQKKSLEDSVVGWQGSNDQTDDMLMVALKHV